MAVHAKDKKISNPRLQCSVCGRWMRLFDRDRKQIFFGGCRFNNGDHLVGNGAEVCDNCCNKSCKELRDKR